MSPAQLLFLNQAPDKKDEWWDALGQLHAQVTAGGDADFAAFLDACRRLVEGAQPDTLSSQITGPYRPAWQAILQAIQ